MSTVEAGHSLPICTSAGPRFFPASDCSWNLEFSVRPFDPPGSASTCSSPGSSLNPVRLPSSVDAYHRNCENQSAGGEKQGCDWSARVSRRRNISWARNWIVKSVSGRENSGIRVARTRLKVTGYKRRRLPSRRADHYYNRTCFVARTPIIPVKRTRHRHNECVLLLAACIFATIEWTQLASH